jgi:membrane-associated PAP2 superfamily phosphatase
VHPPTAAAPLPDRDAPRRRAHRDGRVAALALLGVLAWDLAGLDLPLARLVAGPHGFPAHDSWWAAGLLHTGGRWTGWLVGLALLAVAARPTAPGAPTRRERLFWLGATAVCLLAVPALKALSTTSCPWDLAEFGGVARHVPHWRLGVADGGPGRCFPAGHPVAAFAFLPMAFLWRDHDRRRARLWLAGTLAVGALFGAGQAARGAHFASHTLWSAWLCWSLCAAAAAVAPRVLGHGAPAAARAAPAGPFPWRRLVPWLACAAAGVAVYGLASAWAAVGPPLARGAPSPSVAALAQAVSRLAEPPLAVALAAVLAVVLARHRDGTRLAFLAVALAGNGVLTWSLKQLEARARPPGALAGHAETGFAFPSAHTAGASVFLVVAVHAVLVHAPPRWRGPAIGLAAAALAAVAASRVALGLHGIADVAAGAASGLAWAAVAVAGAELAGWSRGSAGSSRPDARAAPLPLRPHRVGA